MTRNILRSFGAVLLSIFAMFALLIAVEGISALLHPWPEDFAGTPEEVARQVATYPVGILVFLGVVGWGGIMFAITWLATRLGTNRHVGHGYGIGVVFLGLVIMNLSMLPYPIWFWFVLLTVLPVAAYFGTTTAASFKSESEEPS